MYDHYAHAAHNEKVCRHLNNYEEYADWAITSAFYSALHLVRHLMLTEAVQKGDPTDFKALYLKKRTKNMGHHGFQRHYVYTWHPRIKKAYHHLSEMGVKARYDRFTFTREEVVAAQECLDIIRQYVQSIRR